MFQSCRLSGREYVVVRDMLYVTLKHKKGQSEFSRTGTLLSMITVSGSY